MQNTQYCATLTTRNGSALTVSRSSTTLQNRYHQHPSAICKEIEALRSIRYIVDSGETTALFNDAVRFKDCSSLCDVEHFFILVKASNFCVYRGRNFLLNFSTPCI